MRLNGPDKQPRRCVFVVPFPNVVSTIIRTSTAVPLSLNHQLTQTPPNFAHSRFRVKATAEEAVGLLLTRDAVAPSALTSLRSERVARRFCDRLVALGAVQELTGRDTFRLYGI
ncbi:DUF1403 family protein [Leisingera daeponensis]|nr:DUF1403 family protein [Leisingera daeponensis]